MGKKNRRAKNRVDRRRTQAINTAGTASATPRLDRAREMIAELRAEQSALAERALGVEPGQAADVQRAEPTLEIVTPDRWAPPPPPWATP